MQQQFQSDKTEASHLPQIESVAALQTTAGIETEADKLTAQTVTEHLNKITKCAKSARRACVTGAVAISLCMMRTLSFVMQKSDPDKPWGYLFLFLTTMFVIIVVQVFASRLLLRMCSQAVPRFDAEEIAKLGGTKAIEPLFAALKVVSRKQRPAIHDALTSLLPQLRANDAHLLTSNMRNRIRTWLGEQVNTDWNVLCPDDMRIAALKALEQVGNTDDIPVVEKLANLKTRTPEQERVKQAAIECLPMLREHCGEAASAQTLLRASNAEDARPDTLLRAATGLPETSPAELLRGAKKP